MHKHADYVPLHLHSEYSLLDGAIKISELVETSKKWNLPAVAITDHGNMFGAVQFYKSMTKADLKPIIGSELYVAPKSRLDKQKATTAAGPSPKEESPFHLVALAKDNNGYKNLTELVSRAYTEGFYYRPRVDKELLEQYSGGLIFLSACMKGEVAYYLSLDMKDKAREAALFYKHIAGPENYYIELQENGVPAQTDLNKKLLELARELHINVVATNDCHYLRREDARAHDILLCIGTGKTVNDASRLKFQGDGLYFRSPEEMKQAFADLPEAIRNTVEIAERCNVEMKLKGHHLPMFQPETGETPEEYLDKLAHEGLLRHFKGANAPEEYAARLQTELSVIKKMGFSSYFLIVWDFINNARKKGIPVGPGRGSAAGSLVSYSLGITELDPIRY
nr:DNA polymerase III subunit alpha [Nitrospiraceae bacterium]